MPDATGLTGAWKCNDNGTYYIRGMSDGTVAWAGLHNSGFHRGMEFCNVFVGEVSADGATIDGQWADVPRGQTRSDGELRLEIVPPLGQPGGGSPDLVQQPAGSSGGFGGIKWNRTTEVNPLKPQNIVNIEGRVQRYDGQALGDNNPPCRDFTVMWGEVTDVSWPTLPPKGNDYCSFLDGWGGDGDFDFLIAPDWSYLSADFWTSGWVSRVFIDPAAEGYTARPANEHILWLFDRFDEVFRCESPMYARENDDCDDPPVMLLPAWMEQGGNSILMNGQPIDGQVVQVQDDRASPPVKSLEFPLGPGGQLIELKPGVIARVTGVVADDAGHPDQQAPEIHPVFAIDIVQDFKLRSPGADLSGAWHGDDLGTYYLRQIGNTVWWLGMSHDQGRTFANVFRGSHASSTLEGQWIDVPMGLDGILSDGSLTLYGGSKATDLVKNAQVGSFGSQTWTKLYDTATTPPRPSEP
jgi:hypothetical protein